VSPYNCIARLMIRNSMSTRRSLQWHGMSIEVYGNYSLTPN
jgi:hypothetical protein